MPPPGFRSEAIDGFEVAYWARHRRWLLELSEVFDRPLVWVDDELFLDALDWAKRRKASTLLIRPSSSVGLASEHVEQIRRFADVL